MLDNIQIKQTTLDDLNKIKQVEEKSFGYDKEAKLCDDLLHDKTAGPTLSLLAYDGDNPVGHILFTRVYLNEMTSDQPLIHILAPLAIIPEYQKQGIGGLLIKKGLRILKDMGSEMVFVLGHIEYYPKYGFINNAQKFGYTAPYPIPEEVADAWMVQSLNPDGFTIPHGNIICSDELNKPEHWRE